MNNFLLVLLSAFLLTSCTHWFIDTEARIRVRNHTDEDIDRFSILSKTGQHMVLIEYIPTDYDSEPHEVELVGEFEFAVFLNDSLINLGVHKLKGGAVYADIRYEKGNYKMRFR